MPAAIPELPPPNDDDKIGPDNLKTDERTLLNPPADPPLPESPDSPSPFPEPLLDPDELPKSPLLEPDELPRTPLLNPANFCEIADIFGVMTPEMRAWKFGIGIGGSIPSCLFFSIFVLSN